MAIDEWNQLIGYFAGITLVITVMIVVWLAWLERRTMIAWPKYVKQRANPPKPAPLPPIEWDDGLDISHLQVKHEPNREQP